MAEQGLYIPKMADNPFSWYLFETFGAYPSAEDRHVVEFFPERFPERFPNGRYYGKQLGVDAFSFEGTIATGVRFSQKAYLP
jgi:alpha-galactosidase